MPRILDDDPTPAPDDGSVVTLPADPWAGVTLGEYRLIRRLGKGGMGAVYPAQQVRFSPCVAVKVVTTERIAEPSAIASLRLEIAACGRLTHRHIVQALHAGESSGVLFLAMERLEGADLLEVLQAKGPLRAA